MGNALRDRLRAAAIAFAEQVADAVEQSAPSKWVDQDTCAPLKRRTFLLLCRTGELKATERGQQRLVLRDEFEAFLASRPHLSREEETGEQSDDDAAAEALGLRPTRKGERGAA